MPFLTLVQALKVGGAIALETTKGWGAKQRAMYLNLEILGGYSTHSPPFSVPGALGMLD